MQIQVLSPYNTWTNNMQKYTDTKFVMYMYYECNYYKYSFQYVMHF